MNKLTLPALLFSLLMATSTTICADEQQGYGAQVGDKALRGFTNMTTAVLEIPKNIINTTNDSNIAYGAVGGLAKGILNTVGRIMTGLSDFVTAPLPTQQIVQPTYIWDDFDKDTTYGKTFRLKSDN